MFLLQITSIRRILESPGTWQTVVKTHRAIRPLHEMNDAARYQNVIKQGRVGSREHEG